MDGIIFFLFFSFLYEGSLGDFIALFPIFFLLMSNTLHKNGVSLQRTVHPIYFPQLSLALTRLAVELILGLLFLRSLVIS